MLVLWKLMQQMSNQVSTEQFNYIAMRLHGILMKILSETKKLLLYFL